MRAQLRCLTIVIALLYTLSARALSSTRHALVLGNDNYPGNTLHNARNDARAVGKTWESLGYLTTLVLDSDRDRMTRAVDEFVRSLDVGDTVFVYYAGHGFQLEGENYLVPVDFKAVDASDAKTQGFGLSVLLAKLIEHGASTQVVILDSCRDNPFQFTRGIKNGWAPTITSAGSFLAFGTSPGSTAGDAPNDTHGVFTKSLLQYATDPQLDIEQVFQRVRKDVITASGGKQVPWTASSLVGTLHMVPESDVANPSFTQITPVAVSSVGQIDRTIPSVTESVKSERTSKDVSELVNQARGLINSSLWADAGRVLSAALVLDPRCALAYRLLAVVLHMTGRGVEAENILGKAIELAPDEPMAYAYRCLVRAGRSLNASMDDCSKALSLQDNLAVAHVGMAVNLLASTQPGLAADEAGKAIALDPNDPCGFLLRAAAFVAEGRRQEALEDYSKATELAMRLLR